MSHNFKQHVVILCCTLLLLFNIAVPNVQALTASKRAQYSCNMVDIDKNLPNLGKKIPVVLVHGFIGDSSIWTNSIASGASMYNALKTNDHLYVQNNQDISLFDYRSSSTHWVDDPHIGPALAQRIDYLAQASLCTGGIGKVIVIAHSMGGLALRYAAAQVIDGRKVSDELGLVITIATPNFGSLVADVGTIVLDTLCRDPVISIVFGGKTLKAQSDNCKGKVSALTAMQTNLQSGEGTLPMLPQSVPLMGIAGIVHQSFQAFNSHIELDDSDTLVLANSALVGHSQVAQGAGTAVFRCTSPIPFFFWASSNCSHGELPKNPDVQLQVVKSIQAYLTSVLPSACPPDAGTCLGIRSGNVEGDGGSDSVGVLIPPCDANANSPCMLAIRAVSTSGTLASITYNPIIDSPGNANPCHDGTGCPGISTYADESTKFLGLSDIFGTGKDEIVVLNPGCEDGCGILMYEFNGGKLMQVPFYGSSEELEDQSIGSAGFVCRNMKGTTQLVGLTLANQIGNPDGTRPYMEDTYQYDGRGGMKLVSSTQVNLSDTGYTGLVGNGPDCPGLTNS